MAVKQKENGYYQGGFLAHGEKTTTVVKGSLENISPEEVKHVLESHLIFAEMFYRSMVNQFMIVQRQVDGSRRKLYGDIHAFARRSGFR